MAIPDVKGGEVPNEKCGGECKCDGAGKQREGNGVGREEANDCCPRTHLILAGMNRVDIGHSSCLGSIQLDYLA